jgi:dTDP-4-amino-4,6-dideoxygalactose transaminase
VIAARRPAGGGAVVPHSRPLLGEAEQAAAARVIASGRLAPGPEAARCESLVARLSECADALAVSSGTTALTLALRCLGLGPDDQVALPSYACAAVLHAVRAAGASPLVCDIEPSGLALDPEDVARRGGARLRAVILVHPFGMPARLEPFRARGLLVVEDCAQAPGAGDRGRPVGSRGDAAVFSFGPTKVVTCGGPGGALASPRAALVRTARDLADHDESETDRPRVNGLMGDLHAAIAVVQIGRLKEFAARRAALAARYDEALAPLGLERPAAPQGARAIISRYLVRLRSGAEDLVQRLNARGIVARRPVFLPLHRLIGSADRFPAAEAAQSELVSLPLYPALGEAEIERVIEEVRRCRP